MERTKRTGRTRFCSIRYHRFICQTYYCGISTIHPLLQATRLCRVLSSRALPFGDRLYVSRLRSSCPHAIQTSFNLANSQGCGLLHCFDSASSPSLRSSQLSPRKYLCAFTPCFAVLPYISSQPFRHLQHDCQQSFHFRRPTQSELWSKVRAPVPFQGWRKDEIVEQRQGRSETSVPAVAWHLPGTRIDRWVRPL